VKSNYSYGVTTSKEQLDINENDPTKWANPLESRLPNGIVFLHPFLYNTSKVMTYFIYSFFLKKKKNLPYS
jgi:hypothetical protein